MAASIAVGMYWQWDPALSVGVGAIDNQHRRIVEYINELDTALRSGDLGVVGEVIDQMIDYTVTHFAFEEALMERCGYKLLHEHRLVHQSFARRMAEHKKEFAAGKDIGRQLLSELRLWLTNHIKRDDQDYVASAKAMLDEGWVAKTIRRLFKA